MRFVLVLHSNRCSLKHNNIDYNSVSPVTAWSPQDQGQWLMHPYTCISFVLYSNIISTSVYLWSDNHGQLSSIIVFSGNKFTYVGKGTIQYHFLTYHIAGSFWGWKHLWICCSFVAVFGFEASIPIWSCFPSENFLWLSTILLCMSLPRSGCS